MMEEGRADSALEKIIPIDIMNSVTIDHLCPVSDEGPSFLPESSYYAFLHRICLQYYCEYLESNTTLDLWLKT